IDLVSRAMDLGLEPLVEAHDERELERALATPARLIGLNNRDLRTLDVDTERASRLRDLVPEDRLVIAESGVREPATIAAWRALGFDGALVGEVLMRSGEPSATARAFVAAGRAPDDLPNLARTAAVNPDAVQLSGDESVEMAATAGRPAWKVLHLPATAPDAGGLAAGGPAEIAGLVEATIATAKRYLGEGRCERVLLDTAGGPFP